MYYGKNPASVDIPMTAEQIQVHFVRQEKQDDEMRGYLEHLSAPTLLPAPTLHVAKDFTPLAMDELYKRDLGTGE